MKDESKESVSQRERHEIEAQRFKTLYETEVKLRERLSSRLEKANDKANQAQMLSVPLLSIASGLE